MRREPFSGMCCRNTTPCSRPSGESPFPPAMFLHCLARAGVVSELCAQAHQLALLKEAPAVGDLTAGVLSRRSIATAMRVNRDSQKLMRERPAHNYRRFKFFRCDISAKANTRCCQRTLSARTDLTASGGGCARNDSSDAPELRLGVAAAKPPRRARCWLVRLSERRSAMTRCSRNRYPTAAA
jgi:hypothetical protein